MANPEHREPTQPGEPDWPQPETALHAPQPTNQSRPRVRGNAVVGWIMIIIGAAMMISLHLIPAPADSEGEGDVGPVLMEIQGKYIVGASRYTSDSRAMMYNQTSMQLNLGSVAQRHRFVVLAAELQGPAEAAGVLDALDELIAEQQRLNGDDQPVLSDKQRDLHELLRWIYAGDGWEEARQRIGSLTADQRTLFKDQLGWFGQLALAPPGADTTERGEVMSSASTVFGVIIGVAVFIGGLGLCGLIGLIVLAVMSFGGRTTSSMLPGQAHHAIYAETFGIWMLLFPLGQVAASVVGRFVPSLSLLLVLVVFFASLGVLIWPVLRGVPWAEVRRDVGLTLGRQPMVEPLIGIGGYAMGLPMLAVGLVLTLVLLMLQGAFAPMESPLSPAGGPAHPIIMELGGPAIWPKLMLLLLAAVAAPIVEETMFRGVLYRHLRDASRSLGAVASVILGAIVSGFIFAVIHPQGWVAVPALMSLSFAFVLVREWRGTLIPAMIVHGISNFIVISTLIVILSV